jgi:hypothetical protein
MPRRDPLNSDDENERFLGARLLAWHERDSEMFEVVSEMFALEVVRDQPVPAAALVDLALYCVELGRPQTAGTLVKGLAGHFDKFQDENRVLLGHLAICWALLRETVALASSVAPRYLAKAVQAVQSNADDAIADAASELLESRGLLLQSPGGPKGPHEDMITTTSHDQYCYIRRTSSLGFALEDQRR